MIRFGSKKENGKQKALTKPSSASSSPSRSWIVSDFNASQYNGEDFNSYKYNNIDNNVTISNMPVIGRLKVFYQLTLAIILLFVFLITGIYLFYNYSKSNYSYNFLSTNMNNITSNLTSLNNVETDLLNKDVNQFNNLKEIVNELSNNIATLYTIRELDKTTLTKFENDFNITKNKVNYINNSQNFLISSKSSLTNINNFLTKFYLDISTSMESSMLENNLSKNDLIILNKIMSNIYVIKSDISLLLTNNSNLQLLSSINKNNILMKNQFSLLNQMSDSETKKRLIYYYNVYINNIDKYISDIVSKLSNFNNTLNSFGNIDDKSFNWILTEFDTTLLKINKCENLYLYSSLLSFLLFFGSLLLIIVINKYEDNKKYEILKNDYDIFDKDLNKIVEDLIIISQKDITHKISLNGNIKLLTLVDSINQTLNNVREKFDTEINNLQDVSTFIARLPDDNLKLKEILVEQKSIFKNNENEFINFNKEYPEIRKKVDTIKNSLITNKESLIKLEKMNQNVNNGLDIVLNKDIELNDRLVKMDSSIKEISTLITDVLELVEKINMYTLNSKIQAEKNKGTLKNITFMNDKVSNAVKDLTTNTQKITFFINNLNSDMEKSLDDVIRTKEENQESKDLLEKLLNNCDKILEDNNKININFKDIYNYVNKLDSYIKNINDFKENVNINQLSLLSKLDTNKVRIDINKKLIDGVVFNLKTYTNKNSGD